MPGAFVISLDFELHWGGHDKRTVAAWRPHLEGTWRAVPGMLGLFERFGVRVTWATVGFLFARSGHELRSCRPALRPTYVQPQLSPYRLFTDVGDDENDDPFHLAPSLIRRIMTTEGQELGSHTYSHYYCLEPGQTAEQFAADLAAAQAAAAQHNLILRSLVFPRTQINTAYLPICAAAGFTAYRSADPGWMNAPLAGQHPLHRRAARLSDSYLPVTLDTTFDLALRRRDGLVAVPASRFLRPYSRRLHRLERLKVSRILAEMRRAARLGRGYHLWWHPENFGTEVDDNLAMLEAILREFASLRRRYGFRSESMGSLAAQVL